MSAGVCMLHGMSFVCIVSSTLCLVGQAWVVGQG